MQEKINFSKKGYSILKSQGVLIALIILFIFSAVTFKEFATYRNLTNVLRQISMIGIVAIGMEFVILTGGIDLSVGSIAALCGILAAFLSEQNVIVMVLLPIAVGTLIGLVNGCVIVKMKIEPFIGTLAVMMAVRGICYILTNNVSVPVNKTATDFIAISSSYILGIPVPVLILITCTIIAAIISKYSSFGRHVYAVGGNEEAAMMMGLNVNRIKLTVYLLSGFFAGLAGVVLTSRIGTGQPFACNGWEMNAIAAIAIGGTHLSGGVGKFDGTLSGVIILGIITNIINLQGDVNSWWQSIITGIILISVVIIQSQVQRNRAVKQS